MDSALRKIRDEGFLRTTSQYRQSTKEARVRNLCVSAFLDEEQLRVMVHTVKHNLCIFHTLYGLKVGHPPQRSISPRLQMHVLYCDRVRRCKQLFVPLFDIHPMMIQSQKILGETAADMFLCKIQGGR